MLEDIAWEMWSGLGGNGVVDPEQRVLKERLACFNGKEGAEESAYGRFDEGRAVCRRPEG